MKKVNIPHWLKKTLDLVTEMRRSVDDNGTLVTGTLMVHRPGVERGKTQAVGEIVFHIEDCDEGPMTWMTFHVYADKLPVVNPISGG